MKKDSQISRRLFLRATTFAGAGAALGGGFMPLRELDAETRTPFTSSVGSLQSQASGAASPSGSLDEWIERIFSREFAGKRFGPARWDEDGKSYTVLESAHGNREAQELARYDSASGERSVLFSSAELIPPGTKEPLRVEDFEWSRDRKKILIYTNSERVWRENTRGDYWVCEREAKRLRKIGGDAAPSSLMFAKFSPSGDQVAYVRANNIYVEEISSGTIKALTTDGSETTINGTSDWVYEEEFDVRDGFRWSGDGRSIAYFQFDTRPVREFSMINNLGGGFREPIPQVPYPEYGVYPKVSTFRIPSAGTPNSAVRIGVVNVDNAKTKWIDVTADPEKSYIPRMEWLEDSNEILLQHMNRRQSTNDVYLADGATGHAHRIFHDEDKAWLDVNEDTRWLAKHKGFLWANESDGWRHVHVIARDGSGARLITRGDFDVIQILAVDPEEEWIYFIASPDNATQHYLYRARMDGSAAPERVTPPNMDGIHRY
ncbi:MAG: DPP IV N-terminal domain-containing protein, partial [Candidatus Acidiferrales bacterium]